MFERPYFLLALALVIPVAIAFLFKRRDTLATVPSTLLFRRLALARVKNKRWKELLKKAAFLMCLAGVGLLAIAAAGPRPYGRTRSIAIVVDVSASMNGEAFEEARGDLREVLRSRAGRDYIAIVSAGREPACLAGPTLDGDALERAVDALAVERGEADVPAALRLADGLVRDRRRASIVWITDGGAGAFDGRQTRAPLRVLRVGGRRENLGLTVLAARTPDDAADGEREVLVTVAAAGGIGRRARVVLESNGVELGRRDLRIAGGGEREATFRVRTAVDRVTARVEARDGRGDDVRADDRASVELARTEAPRVILVAEEDAPARFFVEQAIRATGVREIEVRAPGGAIPRLGEHQIAVVLGEAPAQRIAGPALYLSTTRGAVPVPIAARLDGEATALRSIDAQHALARGVDLDGASIARAVAVDPTGVESIVELDGGTVVAAGGTGRDRWAYVGVDPSASDLVLRVAFPVLIANALAALSGAGDVRAAETPSRTEVALLPSRAVRSAPRISAPWPVPASPALAIAILAALILLVEGAIAFKGWAR